MRIYFVNLWAGRKTFTISLTPFIAINHDHALTEVALAWLTLSIVIEIGRASCRERVCLSV